MRRSRSVDAVPLSGARPCHRSRGGNSTRTFCGSPSKSCTSMSAAVVGYDSGPRFTRTSFAISGTRVTTKSPSPSPHSSGHHNDSRPPSLSALDRARSAVTRSKRLIATDAKPSTKTHLLARPAAPAKSLFDRLYAQAIATLPQYTPKIVTTSGMYIASRLANLG
jgi:hypothetical protein